MVTETGMCAQKTYYLLLIIFWYSRFLRFINNANIILKPGCFHTCWLQWLHCRAGTVFSHVDFGIVNSSRCYNIFSDLGWLNSIHVNVPAIRLRADVLQSRRSVKREWQAAWLLRAITCIDLTTLGGDDTASNVARLCAKVTITFV